MSLLLNKRILLGLGMIVFVGAIVAGSTGAFFSDTETSTGNTFTAGAIDLKIDSEQHYNGNTCVEDSNSSTGYSWSGNSSYPVPGTECQGTWALKDLDSDSVTGDKFFYFDDLKPGDYGENTISLHVHSNDAYMCASLVNVGEADNTKTEPEAADDPDGNTVGEATGELDNELHFFAWVDHGTTPAWDEDNGEGDNVYQVGEHVLAEPTQASALDDQTWTLADNNLGAFQASSTGYIGVAWCMGAMNVNQNTGEMDCDGQNVDNASQTDSWYTDIEFYVEQARNNEQFSCDPRTRV